jgi:hypothetical protein
VNAARQSQRLAPLSLKVPMVEQISNRIADRGNVLVGGQMELATRTIYAAATRIGNFVSAFAKTGG